MSANAANTRYYLGTNFARKYDGAPDADCLYEHIIFLLGDNPIVITRGTKLDPNKENSSGSDSPTLSFVTQSASYDLVDTGITDSLNIGDTIKVHTNYEDNTQPTTFETPWNEDNCVVTFPTDQTPQYLTEAGVAINAIALARGMDYTLMYLGEDDGTDVWLVLNPNGVEKKGLELVNGALLTDTQKLAIYRYLAERNATGERVPNSLGIDYVTYHSETIDDGVSTKIVVKYIDSNIKEDHIEARTVDGNTFFMNEQVDVNFKDIADIKETAENAEKEVNSVKNDVTTLQGDVTTLEQSLNTLDAGINQRIDSRTSSIKANVRELQDEPTADVFGAQSELPHKKRGLAYIDGDKRNYVEIEDRQVSSQNITVDGGTGNNLWCGILSVEGTKRVYFEHETNLSDIGVKRRVKIFRFNANLFQTHQTWTDHYWDNYLVNGTLNFDNIPSTDYEELDLDFTRINEAGEFKTFYENEEADEPTTHFCDRTYCDIVGDGRILIVHAWDGAVSGAFTIQGGEKKLFAGKSSYYLFGASSDSSIELQSEFHHGYDTVVLDGENVWADNGILGIDVNSSKTEAYPYFWRRGHGRVYVKLLTASRIFNFNQNRYEIVLEMQTVSEPVNIMSADWEEVVINTASDYKKESVSIIDNNSIVEVRADIGNRVIDLRGETSNTYDICFVSPSLYETVIYYKGTDTLNIVPQSPLTMEDLCFVNEEPELDSDGEYILSIQNNTLVYGTLTRGVTPIVEEEEEEE